MLSKVKVNWRRLNSPNKIVAEEEKTALTDKEKDNECERKKCTRCNKTHNQREYCPAKKAERLAFALSATLRQCKSEIL